MKKRMLSILLTLCMVLCLMPAAVFADGSTAPADITGSGTVDDPYLIYTAGGLKAFRDKVNGQNGLTKQPGAHGKLMADIVLNDGMFDEDGNWSKTGTPEAWTPISGSNINPYSGTFDGQGHTIKGLYVTGDLAYAGLFGFVNGAVIKNVTVDGYVGISGYFSDVSVDPSVGGIVGCAVNTNIESCTNLCTVKVNCSGAANNCYVGGIAGNIYSSGTTWYSVTNCHNGGKVILKAEGFKLHIGGIAGQVAMMSVSGCYNTGAIKAASGDFEKNFYVGGVIGLSCSFVNNCYNAGVITVTGNFTVVDDSVYNASACFGGVVGICQYDPGAVSNCFNTGAVAYTGSCDKVNVGGVAGVNFFSTVTDCCFLTGTAENGVANTEGDEAVSNTFAKSKAAFADGTVLNLLKEKDTTNTWDRIGYIKAVGMNLPLLRGQADDSKEYDIYIADNDGNVVRITTLNCEDVLGDGKVSFAYDEVNEKGILTLNGAELSSEYEFPIDASDIENLEIVLKGENKIHAEGTCISAQNLTFSGEGSLEITNLFFYAVDCTGDVTVKGGSIKIDSPDSALCFDGAFTVNGGTVELIGTAGTAIVPDFEDTVVILGDDRIMIAGRFYNGSDAQVTATSDEDAISVAKYIKILNKYIPITYNPGQYGTGSAVTQNKIYDEDFGLSNVLFTRVGYKQISWTTAENGGEILRLGSAYSGNEPLKLYPVWEMEQYGITYDLGGGTVTGNPEHYNVESESFTLHNPERDGGYEFAGWSGTGLNGTDNRTVTVPKGSTGDREYTAHWRDIQAPTIDGLQNGKTYCSAVEFTAADNDGIASVTANGMSLQAENGKYTLSPAQGEQTVVVKDSAGNSVEVTVIVNDGHTGGTATCRNQAVCAFCGENYGGLNDNNHANLKHVYAKAATKDAEGNCEYWYCSDCGKYYKDAEATQEITKEQTVTAKLSDDSKSTQTGDDFNPALWIALLFISSGAVTVTMIVRRKKCCR